MPAVRGSGDEVCAVAINDGTEDAWDTTKLCVVDLLWGESVLSDANCALESGELMEVLEACARIDSVTGLRYDNGFRESSRLRRPSRE